MEAALDAMDATATSGAPLNCSIAPSVVTITVSSVRQIVIRTMQASRFSARIDKLELVMTETVGLNSLRCGEMVTAVMSVEKDSKEVCGFTGVISAIVTFVYVVARSMPLSLIGSKQRSSVAVAVSSHDLPEILTMHPIT